VKKTQLLWMLENDKIRVSTDLRERFIPRRTITINENDDNNRDIWKSDKVSKGDYIILRVGGNIFFGQVLNFKRLGQRSKSASTYYRDTVELSSTDNIGVFLNPLFSILNSSKIELDNFDFYELSSYIFHAKSDLNFSLRRVKNLLRNQ
jgi:hypothetical protein